MKKSLQLLCLAIALALIPASLLVAGDLPANSHAFVEKKYAGWNGVLRGWISTRWEAAGSFVTWLNACATEFEKDHEGVYLEFTQVEEGVLQEMQSSGIRLPELLFFSPGMLENTGGLLPLDIPVDLLPDLQSYGDGAATPVAMGGYIWVYNRLLCEGAPMEPGQISSLLPDEEGRSFSAALLALMSTDVSATDEIELPEAGIDLGLPANADASPLQSADALELFNDGELPFLPVTQAELARLLRLRDAGKGPDWNCFVSGDYALADQLLLTSAVDQTDAAGDAREELAEKFIAFLCSAECQEMLASIGAFPTTSVQIYDSFSAYASLAGLLQTRRLLTPEVFSEYSNRNSAGIVRNFQSGSLSAIEGLRQMGYLPEG